MQHSAGKMRSNGPFSPRRRAATSARPIVSAASAHRRKKRTVHKRGDTRVNRALANGGGKRAFVQTAAQKRMYSGPYLAKGRPLRDEAAACRCRAPRDRCGVPFGRPTRLNNSPSSARNRPADGGRRGRLSVPPRPRSGSRSCGTATRSCRRGGRNCPP